METQAQTISSMQTDSTPEHFPNNQAPSDPANINTGASTNSADPAPVPPTSPNIIDLDSEPVPMNLSTTQKGVAKSASIPSTAAPVIVLEEDNGPCENMTPSDPSKPAQGLAPMSVDQPQPSPPQQEQLQHVMGQVYTIPIPNLPYTDGPIFPHTIPPAKPQNESQIQPHQNPKLVPAQHGVDSSDSNESTKKPNNRRGQHHQQVGRSYENLAKKFSWKNPDGSIFPVQVDGLCKYMRFKADTSNPRSVEWYVAALKKYHLEVLGIERWDEIRKHPKVRKVTEEIEEEAAAKMREAENNDTISSSAQRGRGRGKQVQASQKNSSNPLSSTYSNKYPPIWPTPSPSNTMLGSSTVGTSTLGALNPQLDPEKRPAEAILALLGVEGPEEEQNQPESKSAQPTVINLDSDDDQEPQSVPATSTVANPPSVSTRPRRNLNYADSNENADEHAPPKQSKKRRKRELDMILPEAEGEPESFKYRYDCALAVLRSKYIGQCVKHPRGCFEIEANRHLLLSDKMVRHWAALMASGDDVTEEALPNFLEMPEFSEKAATTIKV